MTAALALLFAAQTATLAPTDDVWVYHFAPDQTSDPFLRCWGAEGLSSADPNIGDAGSWSAMKFDVSKLPSGKLLGTTLTLYFVPNPNIDPEIGKKYPLEVRSTSAEFEEENFSFEGAEKIRPKADKAFLLATKPIEFYANATEPVKVEIDLGGSEGKFMAALQQARKSPKHELGLAFTTALTPDEAGESMIYKFYSRNSEKATQPVLTLKFE
ncbi:MAG: hypothetical protein JNM28_07835 [Armatimonadetes bacterium]|nr:hypothetical protein [Armatimonadota bacterium]